MSRHSQQQADSDVALVLASGISGIHPANIEGYVLFTVNRECGVHLTTDACCVYHAVEQVVEAWKSEQSALVPCADGPG